MAPFTIVALSLTMAGIAIQLVMSLTSRGAPERAAGDVDSATEAVASTPATAPGSAPAS